MLNLPTFVFINGPAGSGKSTLASAICEAVPGCWRESFAEPIRDMIRNVFFPEDGPLWQTHNLKDQEVKKQILANLAGISDPHSLHTVREVMIDFFEKFMKPRFGEDVFGRLLWRRCQEQASWYNHFIIDDSGFAPEANYVISQVGEQHCCLIRLHRDSCSFAGDSRSYIHLPIKSFDLDNSGTIPQLLDELQLKLGNL